MPASLRGAALAAILSGLVLAACGSAGGPGGPTSPDPDEPVSTSAPPGNGAGPSEPVGTPVGPQPGTRDPRPHAVDRFDVGDDDRTITVLYVGGVEDCYRLDRVEVVETAETVTITVHEGVVPDLPPDSACIDIAVYKAVAVVLDAPLGDRELLDGAA
jgi:hypothetical protein